MSYVRGFLFAALTLATVLFALHCLSPKAKACPPVVFGSSAIVVQSPVFVQSVPTVTVSPFFVNAVAVQSFAVPVRQQVVVQRNVCSFGHCGQSVQAFAFSGRGRGVSAAASFGGVSAAAVGSSRASVRPTFFGRGVVARAR